MGKLNIFCLYLMLAGFIFPGGVLAEGAHKHDKARAVPPAAQTVSLGLKAYPDPAGGYNLHLEIANFRFSPENIGKMTEAVEGHAHLYVNMKKIGRIYGTWHHLPGSLLGPGINNIRVTLNDNNHRNWTQGDDWLGASLRLDGAGNVKVDRTIDLVPGAAGEAPKTVTAIKGQTVRLNITAAAGQELHLHGYDLHLKAGLDGRVSMVVTLDHSGRFALLVHTKDNLLGMKETAFAYLEVRSK